MSRLLVAFDLMEPRRTRLAEGMPAYGSCAGMILLASEILDAGVEGRAAILDLGAAREREFVATLCVNRSNARARADRRADPCALAATR